jgi:hypothetical protein
MLTFSEKTWARWLDLQSGFHLNRWRVVDYVQAAHDAGLVDIGYEPILRDEAGLQKILPRLHKRFRSLQPELLAILCIYLYGKKPDITIPAI